MAAASLSHFLLDIAVTRIGVPQIDFLLSYAVISCEVTVLIVAAKTKVLDISVGFCYPQKALGASGGYAASKRSFFV